jgi:hypothetical protein
MDILKESSKNQMLASLGTLNQCIENCPPQEWNESHKDAPFHRYYFIPSLKT